MKVHQNLEGISYEMGYKALEKKGVAIVGISPGNSYFKQALITELIDFTSSLFSKMYVIVPDKPFEHTLSAFGHTRDKARKYARIQGNDLKQRISKGIEGTAQKNQSQALSIHHLDWQTDIETSPAYQEKLHYIAELYKTNQDFHRDTIAEVRAVIEGNPQRKEPNITQSMLEEGAQYRLKEFAFLMAAPAILQTNDIAKIYHKKWQLWDAFCEGKYGKHLPIIGSLVISHSE